MLQITACVLRALCLQVERLARLFNVAKDVAYTCKTAAHLHALSRCARLAGLWHCRLRARAFGACVTAA